MIPTNCLALCTPTIQSDRIVSETVHKYLYAYVAIKVQRRDFVFDNTYHL